MTQPAVTQQIKNLERHLGIRLFVRTPRGVRATAEADELAITIAPSIDLLSSVFGRIDRGVLDHPVIRLGGRAEVLSTWALPAIDATIRRGVRVHIASRQPADLVSALITGQIDLALVSGRPTARGIVAVTLLDEELVMLAAPAVAARIRNLLPTDPAAALGQARTVCHPAGLPMLRTYRRDVLGLGAEAEPEVMLPDLHSVVVCAAKGAGVCVLPRYWVTDELAEGSLVPVVEPAEPPTDVLFLAVRTANARESPVGVVYRELLAHAGRVQAPQATTLAAADVPPPAPGIAPRRQRPGPARGLKSRTSFAS